MQQLLSDPEAMVLLAIGLAYAIPILAAMAIAKSRGRSVFVGFFLAALLGPVGAVACCFLPEKRRWKRRHR